MICQNILRRSSLWDVGTIRGNRSPNNAKEKQPDIPGHGFIIKDATNIIWNTGLITECHQNRLW